MSKSNGILRAYRMEAVAIVNFGMLRVYNETDHQMFWKLQKVQVHVKNLNN